MVGQWLSCFAQLSFWRTEVDVEVELGRRGEVCTPPRLESGMAATREVEGEVACGGGVEVGRVGCRFVHERTIARHQRSNTSVP